MAISQQCCYEFCQGCVFPVQLLCSLALLSAHVHVIILARFRENQRWTNLRVTIACHLSPLFYGGKQWIQIGDPVELVTY